MSQHLAQLIKTASYAGLSIHYGQVQSLQTGPASLTINFSGSTTSVTGIRYLKSYTPTAGDFVAAIHTGDPRNKRGGGDWLVLGTVAQ